MNNAIAVQLLIPLITMIITLLYVVITYKQVRASRESVDAMKEQTLLNLQPCIVINNITTHGTKVFTEYGRRQLGVNVELFNIGNSPALSIYVFSRFELANMKNENNNSVEMYFLPDYLTHIKANDKRKTHVRYEEKEIAILVDDLRITYEKNMERIANNPTDKTCSSPSLVVEVFYKNQLGQWFCHSYKAQVMWLVIKDKKRNTNDINENTIPPNKLTSEIQFELQLTSELLAETENRLVYSGEVIKKLEKYKEW